MRGRLRWANIVAMWWTADPHSGVRFPGPPFLLELWTLGMPYSFGASCLAIVPVVMQTPTAGSTSASFWAEVLGAAVGSILVIGGTLVLWLLQRRVTARRNNAALLHQLAAEMRQNMQNLDLMILFHKIMKDGKGPRPGMPADLPSHVSTEVFERIIRRGPPEFLAKAGLVEDIRSAYGLIYQVEDSLRVYRRFFEDPTAKNRSRLAYVENRQVLWWRAKLRTRDDLKKLREKFKLDVPAYNYSALFLPLPSVDTLEKLAAADELATQLATSMQEAAGAQVKAEDGTTGQVPTISTLSRVRKNLRPAR